MARLRLGVIGIGRRWKAALVSMRAEIRIEQAEGVLELLKRPGLDAVLLGKMWYALWPLPHAIEAGKPVLCLASPLADEATLDAIEGRDAAIRYAPWPALELVARSLAKIPFGPPRSMQSVWAHPAEGPALTHAHALALLQMAGTFLGEAVHVRAMGGCVLLNHGEGRESQFLFGKGINPSCHLRIEGESGGVSVDLPGRLRWRDGAGWHEWCPPAGMAELAVLESFLADVRAGKLGGGIGPALAWLRRAREATRDGS